MAVIIIILAVVFAGILMLTTSFIIHDLIQMIWEWWKE